MLIALFTIPLSLIAAALVLDMLGETFNAISFAGLAVALAVVIDEAVAGAENVARRLRQHREAGSDRPTADIVRDATSEMRSPLAYAAFISLLAIVPVAVMEGRPGAFFEPLALAYALAVATAMVVALTVTPALSMLLFSRGSGRAPRVAACWPRSGRATTRRSSKVAGKARPIIIGAAALVVVGALGFALQDKSVIPSFKDRDVLVSLDAEPGTSNTRMTEIATQVSRELRSLPRRRQRRRARRPRGRRRPAPGRELRRRLGEHRLRRRLRQDVRVDRGRGRAACRASESDVITYSEQKIRDVGALRDGQNLATGEGLDVLTGSDKPLAVRVYGENLDVLRREAGKVQHADVADRRRRRSARRAADRRSPTSRSRSTSTRLARSAIKPGDVRRAEATLVQGLIVGSVFEDQKVFEVVVKGTPETRRSIADVRNLLLDTPGGGQVRLEPGGRRAGQGPADLDPA